MAPVVLKPDVGERGSGVTITENMMLVAAVFIQIPVAMIVAAQILNLRASRLIATLAALITAVFVLAGGSLKPHYVFFASCELIALLLIIRLVWQAPGATRA